MPFNWLKKKTTEPTSKPRLPIKAASSSANGRKVENDIQQQQRLRTLDEPLESCLDFTGIQPQGRCGFTTCVHDETLKSGGNMTEEQSDKLRKDGLFRDRVLAAESLEECLKIIEAEAANLQFEEPQKSLKIVDAKASTLDCNVKLKTPDQFPEEHNTNTSDEFSLWGNRIR